MSFADGELWPRNPETFDYGFPKPDPEPIGGCPTCADLVARRARCRKVNNRSGATDMNVLCRKHQDEEHITPEQRARTVEL